MTTDDFAAFTEEADYEKGFAGYYQQHIVPLLDKLEDDRQADYRKFITTAALGTIVAGTVFMLLFFSGTLLADPGLQHTIDQIARGFSKHGNSVGEGKVKIMFFAVFIATIYPGIVYKRYGSEAKSVLLPPLLKFFGDLEYFPTSHFSEVRIEPFSIMPRHTSYSSENNVSGALDNVPLSLAEITLVEGSGRNRTTTFNGLAVILQMNKPFTGKTIVRHNNGTIDKWFQGKMAGLETVTLEDPRFNKTFEVYATDQVEARYLLTTAFMERLMDMSTLMSHWGMNPRTMAEDAKAVSPNIGLTEFSGMIRRGLPMMTSMYGGLRCSFYGDSLLLLIPCHKDLFAPGTLFESAYRIDEIRCVLYQVYLLRRIIEILKLDQRDITVPAASETVSHAETPITEIPIAPAATPLPETPIVAAARPETSSGAPLHNPVPPDAW